MADCHGVKLLSYRAPQSDAKPILPLIAATKSELGSVKHFQDLVLKTCSSDRADSFCIVNFSRSHLGQTGDGHFSPIGGYHQAKDLVLVMDVARFKYPPFWVPLRELYDSMRVVDKETGQPRGYFLVTNTPVGKRGCNHSHC